MPDYAADLYLALPEIFLLSSACLILIIDAFLHRGTKTTTYLLSLAALAGTFLLTLHVSTPDTQLLFADSYIRDPASDLIKLGLLAVTFLALIYARDDLLEQDLLRGEYFTLVLFATLGMLVIASAYSFLTLYLGLELLALSLYSLVPFNRDSPTGSEAGIKYFVLGALASGMLLYGISMLYGATSALTFAEVAAAIQAGQVDQTVLVFGLVFIVIGVAFKFGAIPFHMWVPDVYQGAPTSVVLFLSSAPKIAAFALALRLLADGLPDLSAHWQNMLAILAVLSMALGNVVAIAQTNIKRMFAYSTIAHVGFIFLGLLAANEKGYAAALFYSLVYALTAVGGFGVLAMLSRQGLNAEQIDDLRGLHQRSPWIALMMLLLLFSMAGVPPTVGFFAKLFVLEAIVSLDQIGLALIAVFFSIIGAYYYLRVIKVMYFDQPDTKAQPVRITFGSTTALSINGLSVLALGIFPASLFALCQAAFGP
ncbi:MAG: NADH-quinone oxidoreductase subunit NuoN [Pseudomonadota bacterium]